MYTVFPLVFWGAGSGTVNSALVIYLFINIFDIF